MNNQFKPKEFFLKSASDLFLSEFHSAIDKALEFINAASTNRLQYLERNGNFADNQLDNFL